MRTLLTIIAIFCNFTLWVWANDQHPTTAIGHDILGYYSIGIYAFTALEAAILAVAWRPSK